MHTVQRKICLVGSFAVGKTSLVRRFVDGRFDDRYLSTIGVKISRRTVTLDESIVKLLLWDLAGGDDVLRSNDSYLRGLAGAVIVCDLTREETLDVALAYAEKVHALNVDAPILLVANKSDLVDERRIKDAQLNEAMVKMGATASYLTSAKSGNSVEEAFERLALEVSR